MRNVQPILYIIRKKYNGTYEYVGDRIKNADRKKGNILPFFVCIIIAV